MVAFEVDEIDPADETGWSMLVTGVARELTAPEDIAEVSVKPPARWAPGSDGRSIAISADILSGRRILRA